MSEKTDKPMTVAEAGRRGGMKTKERYGSEYYSEIGRLGGYRVKELVAEAKAAEQEQGE